MNTFLLALYLKLNLLLAIALVLWLLTKTVTRMAGIEISQARQLVVARYLFISLLLTVPGLLLIKLLVPPWLTGFGAVLKGQLLTTDIIVVAGLDSSLEQQYSIGNMSVSLAALVTGILLTGFALQFTRLAIQVAKLKRIIRGAAEWKCICNIHLLFSPLVSTPFSTRALGRFDVVLPYQLLDSPRNLRLAVKHELQHLRNGDLEWVILLEAAKLLCFWNPAVYLWHNEFDCLQEFACDEVLVQERKVSSHAYGNCLLEVASASIGGALIAASNMVPRFSLLRNNHSQLKRRVLMLANIKNSKHVSLKLAGYGLLVGIGLLNSLLVVFAAETEKQAADIKRDFIPTTRINPQYPANALEQKMEGWVQLQFTIDQTGSVRDVTVLDNCVRPQAATEDTCTPANVFNDVSVAAISQWKYEPTLENGVAISVAGLKTIMRYELQD